MPPLLCFLPPPRPAYAEGKSRWQLARELDYVGVFLLAVGLGVFLVGVIWAGGERRACDFSSQR